MNDRIAPELVHLRPAEGGERRACRMLLQGADRLGHLGELWIATTADPASQILGALSLLTLRRTEAASAVLVSGRVVRHWRGRGIGSLLLDTAIAATRHLGGRALLSQVDPAADPDGIAFLAAKGFERTEFLTTFEVATSRVVESLGPLIDRLRQSDRIPSDARMVPLRQAPLVAAARLHADHLAGTVHGVAETLNDLLVRDDADDHAVLMIGDEVHGLFVGNDVDGIAVVDAEVLAPASRVSGGSSGWASAFMLAERLEWGLLRGTRLIRFSCVSGNRPTRRLAQRLGATPIREETVFRLTIDR